jgi:hypothetical protein
MFLGTLLILILHLGINAPAFKTQAESMVSIIGTVEQVRGLVFASTSALHYAQSYHRNLMEHCSIKLITIPRQCKSNSKGNIIFYDGHPFQQMFISQPDMVFIRFQDCTKDLLSINTKF